MAVPLLDNAAKDLRRLREIVRVLARHGFGELVRKTPDVPTDVQDAADQAAPTDANPPARRFRLMLEELGPTFIKLGQVLSSRPDLISREYLEELKHLQYECEPLPFSQIAVALQSALGADPSKYFSHVEEAPLATASIAQVHRATTHDGQHVVLKVQRPGIDRQIQADIDVLYRFAKFLDSAIEESAAIEPTGVVREFETAITAELDFRIEADNLREFYRSHAERDDDVVIPKVHDALSSASLLTLEFLDGVPFTSLPKEGLDRKKIARRVLREAFEEVFLDGFFHADPHPGNILLLKDGRYAILDLGVCGRLTQKMRDTIVVLALAIALKDADTAARTLYRLGHTDARVSISALRDDIRSLFARYLDRPIESVDSTLLGQELLSLAIKHQIRVPSEYTMLARACATIEGVVRQLDPEIDIAREAMPYAERLLFDRVGPGNMEGGIYRALLQLQGLSEDLPIQISQVLADAAAGNFHVNVRGGAMDRLSNAIVTASAVLSGSIVLAAFIVGGFLAVASVNWKVLGIPIAAIIAAIGAITVFSWVGAYAVIWPRLRRFSLVQLFSRRR